VETQILDTNPYENASNLKMSVKNVK